ncbi:hypothetical protein MTO96_027786 [Rhipicephalus appendiculatus]
MQPRCLSDLKCGSFDRLALATKGATAAAVADDAATEAAKTVMVGRRHLGNAVRGRDVRSQRQRVPYTPPVRRGT